MLNSKQEGEAKQKDLMIQKLLALEEQLQQTCKERDSLSTQLAELKEQLQIKTDES